MNILRTPASHFRLASRVFASNRVTMLQKVNMSSKVGTTNTGNKPLDPYKAKNLDDPNLETKVKDLVAFVDKCKYCMMATHTPDTGLIVSRCMALAGKVSTSIHDIVITVIDHQTGEQRDRLHLPRQRRIRQDRRPKSR